MAACRRASDRVGVGMAGSGDILAIGVKLHGEANLGDELAYQRANHVHAENALTADPAADHDDIIIGGCLRWGRGHDRLSTRTILQAAGSFLR
jgi:hypothetical protein